MCGFDDYDLHLFFSQKSVQKPPAKATTPTATPTTHRPQPSPPLLSSPQAPSPLTTRNHQRPHNRHRRTCQRTGGGTRVKSGLVGGGSSTVEADVVVLTTASALGIGAVRALGLGLVGGPTDPLRWRKLGLGLMAAAAANDDDVVVPSARYNEGEVRSARVCASVHTTGRGANEHTWRLTCVQTVDQLPHSRPARKTRVCS
jgi:hypothetical protein